MPGSRRQSKHVTAPARVASPGDAVASLASARRLLPLVPSITEVDHGRIRDGTGVSRDVHVIPLDSRFEPELNCRVDHPVAVSLVVRCGHAIQSAVGLALAVRMSSTLGLPWAMSANHGSARTSWLPICRQITCGALFDVSYSVARERCYGWPPRTSLEGDKRLAGGGSDRRQRGQRDGRDVDGAGDRRAAERWSL